METFADAASWFVQTAALHPVFVGVPVLALAAGAWAARRRASRRRAAKLGHAAKEK